MNDSCQALSGRRQFLKNFWCISAASYLGGLVSKDLLLADVTPGTGVIYLRINQFPVLATEGGSVRLTAGPLSPIMVNRGAANTFHAVSIVCQHQGCFLPTYNHSVQYIQCGCHGSRYAIDGSLLRGPALTGLERFDAAFDGQNTVQIRAPGLAFDVKSISIHSTQGNTRRIALTFEAAPFNNYRVYHRPVLTDAPTQVSFATTSSGPATTMQTRPTAAGNVTVYVDTTGQQAFYSVALQVAEYQG